MTVPDLLGSLRHKQIHRTCRSECCINPKMIGNLAESKTSSGAGMHNGMHCQDVLQN